jgi:hypothetical protein
VLPHLLGASPIMVAFDEWDSGSVETGSDCT